MEITFTGKIWFWKGPAPFFFVTVPAKHAKNIKGISALATYGWGMIPITVQIGKTKWKTALWPKDGKYIVPLKTIVRKAEKLEKDDKVTVKLEVVFKY